MDSLAVINKLQEHFDHSTDEGRARAQFILEILEESTPGVEELIDLAVERVVRGNFTPGDCWVLCRLLNLHISQSAAKQQEVVTRICSHISNVLTKGCYIIQAFYFFYETMVRVTAAVAVSEVSNALRKTFSIYISQLKKDEKAIMTLLTHLRYLAIEHCENNPGFCYNLCDDLIQAFNTMADSFTKDQNSMIKAYLLVLKARCRLQTKQYKHSKQLCKQACELEEYENHIPLELWANALDKEGQYGAALDKLELALKCVKMKEDGEIDNWEKIQELQNFIDNLRLKMSSQEEQSTELDPGWLTDTNIHIPEIQHEQARRKNDSHIKKKKRSRPKTRKPAREVQDRLLDRLKDFPLPSPNPSTQHPLTMGADSNSFLTYKKWELSSEEGESDLEDAFQLPEPEFDEKEPQVTKVKPEEQGRTWFDESKDERNNSKSPFCGMETNVDPSKFDAGKKQLTRDRFYPTMKSADELKRLMAEMPERYKRCRLELESSHKAVCKVLTGTETYSEIEIHGRSKCGQNFNNDEVCVEVLADDRSSISHLRTHRKTLKEDAKVYGQVIGVLKRNFRDQKHPVMACTCDNDEGFLMRPLCRTVLKMHALNGVTKKKYPSMLKHRIDMYDINEEGNIDFKKYFDVKPELKERYVFLVVYLTWGIHHVYPLGAVVEVLDCGTDFHGGLKILEMQHKVPTLYPQDTVAHVSEILEKRVTVFVDDRADCTGLEVFTIDPAHSKDLDDALSISAKDDHYLIGVHIADVAAVVKKGDPVDREAQKRGTSFYPSDSRTRNMLPEPLSEGLCSLLPHQEKLALSIFFHMKKSGKLVKEPTVMKTIIRSSCKLSYEDAQKIIENDEVDHVSQSLKDNVKLLHEIAQTLRKDRLDDSRFAVPFEDPRFIETEILKQNMEAHALIEEFMIKANTSIAQWLRKKFPDSIPIRCQSAPSTEDVQKFVQSEEKFLDLVVNLQGREVLPGRKVASKNLVAKGNTVRKEHLPIQRNIWLQILDGVHNETDKTVRNMCKDEAHPFQAIALQHWRGIMESAEYKCSMLSEKELSHFSLNTKMYTHFTSPIRRDVDLVVHRLVHAALDGESCPYTPSEIAEMCAHINDATSRQKHFSNGCQALKRAEKISQRPMVFNAVVEKVTDSGAVLCIPSLKHVSSRSKELPFNLMDFSKKPEEKQDPRSSKTIVTGQWKKRLYDCTGCPSQLTYSKILEKQQGPKEKRPKQVVSVVNPNQHVYFVDTQMWARMLNELFSKDFKELMKMIKSQPQDGQDMSSGPPVRDSVTSEYGDGSIKFQQCKFTLCLTPGRVIKVQMTANPEKGLLTPQVRLFQVCKNLSLCLSHIKDPVGVLSKYATESTNQTLESVAEYQRAWLPLLEMNAAMTAATNEENVVINNVAINFKRSQMTTHTGSFTLQGNFMRERCIEFGGKSIDKLKEGDSTDEDSGMRKVVSIDYLCIRCQIPQITNATIELGADGTESSRRTKSSTKHKKRMAKTVGTRDIKSSDTDSYTWVGHAQILKVRRRGKKTDSDHVDITFNLNSNSDPVPDCLLSQASGAVEIIMKSEVDRRTMTVLQHLDNKNDLAKAIALGGPLPELENKRLKAGNQIEKEIRHLLLPPNNYMQEEAISRALTSSFSLIQGPPGTGKTYTGIKLIYLFVRINEMMDQEGTNKKKQVLFCGPSNKAVDLVGRLLLKHLANIYPRIVRVYGQSIVSQDYPVPKRNFWSKKSLRGSYSDKKLRNISLHHMIRQPKNTYAKDIKNLDSSFRDHYNDVTSDDRKKYSELIFNASCEELEKCDVILSTCAVAGNRFITSANVFQVIIDESAMSTEPQTMVPIIATEAKQVVLIGDHKQLRPIVQCRAAADLGLNRSLFERYASQALFLDTQYRMHPKICQIPSDIFYEEGLRTGRSLLWRIDRPLRLWPVTDVPYLMWHVEGIEDVLRVSAEEGNEQSRSNRAEIDIVEEVFNWLTNKERIDPTTINVMSQYNAQCSRIKERLKRGHGDINVNTVVASQGGEWDYVIFSTVRSLPLYKIERGPTLGWRRQNLGFITDANQVNVALTRARKGLIIIGNVNLLRTDDVFKQVITRYEAQGCVVEGQHCPPARRQRSL